MRLGTTRKNSNNTTSSSRSTGIASTEEETATLKIFENPMSNKKNNNSDELQSSNKNLEDENRRLREQLQNLLLVPGKAESSLSSSSAENVPKRLRKKDEIQSSLSGTVSQQQYEREKQQQSDKEKILQETVNSLKETNKKQMHNLKKYKTKLKKAKESITKRDVVISRLKKQQQQHEQDLNKMKKSATSTPKTTEKKWEEQMQNLILEKRLCENRNQILSCQIDASVEREKKLVEELDSVKRQQQRRRSSSVVVGKSSRMSTNGCNVTPSPSPSNINPLILQSDNSIQLKEELEKKIERIVLLELELEFCNEKIEDLEALYAQKQEGGDEFHDMVNVEGSEDDDESSGDDEEDDLGANTRQVFLTRFMDVSVGESHVQLPFRHRKR